MVIVTQLQQTTVDVLKCIFFNRLKEYMEIQWYGLTDCDLITREQHLSKMFAYLNMVNKCTLDDQLECAIKDFTKKYSNICVFTKIDCQSSVDVLDTNYVEEIDYLKTELGSILTTEDSDKLIPNA